MKKQIEKNVNIFIKNRKVMKKFLKIAKIKEKAPAHVYPCIIIYDGCGWKYSNDVVSIETKKLKKCIYYKKGGLE